MAYVYCRLAILLACIVLLDAAGQVDVAREPSHRKDFPGKPNITNRMFTTVQPPKDIHNRKKVKSVQPQKKEKNGIVSVRAQTRSTTELHCVVGMLTETGNFTANWVKFNADNSTTEIASNNVIVSYDNRFYASNKTNPMDWILYIRYSQSSDEGLYQCQSSNGTVTKICLIQLELIEAKARIIGGDRKEVQKPGSPLRLSCVLEDSIEPPAYIFWYRGDRVINYDLNDGATVRDGRQGSELIFPMAREEHAGNYSCVPSNAQQASVEVVFLSATPGNESREKSSGNKPQPEDYNVNMLVFVWGLYLYRRHYRMQT